MPTTHVGDPVQPLLHRADPRRIGVQGVREPVQVARHLTEAKGEVAQLGRRRPELRREPLERRERPLGRRGERACAFALVGVDRGNGSRRALAELGDVPEPLALGPERVLLPGGEVIGVLHERLELGEPRTLGIGSAFELLDAALGRLERPPRIACVAPAGTLVRPDERVEEVELVRRSRETALCELPREDEQALGRCDDVLAGDAPAPRVSARAPVRRHAAGDDEPRLVVRAQVAKRLEPLLVEESVRDVELRLDVRLAPGRADGGGVALGAEEQADRLGHDRLPRAGLARQGDEAGRELELGLADENEVLDAQTAQHRGDRRPGTRVANTWPERAEG